MDQQRPQDLRRPQQLELVQPLQRRSGPSTAKRGDLDAVRAWARDNGHTVSDRGRVSNKILEAYDAR